MRVFAEHDPAAIAWRGKCRQRSPRPNPDLPRAGSAADLLDAVVYMGPVPKLPPFEQNGCGPSTLISPAHNAKASPRLTPCHWKASRKNCVMIE